MLSVNLSFRLCVDPHWILADKKTHYVKVVRGEVDYDANVSDAGWEWAHTATDDLENATYWPSSSSF